MWHPESVEIALDVSVANSLNICTKFVDQIEMIRNKILTVVWSDLFSLIQYSIVPKAVRFVDIKWYVFDYSVSCLAM